MNNEERVGLKKYRADIIVIAVLLSVSVLALLFSNLLRKEGAYLQVEIDGTVSASYPLFENAVYSLNGGTNELTVKDGVAYMTYSDCPDHTCENTGRVKYVGQTIVCLPNRVSITVVGTSDSSVDFVS